MVISTIEIGEDRVWVPLPFVLFSVLVPIDSCPLFPSINHFACYLSSDPKNTNTATTTAPMMMTDCGRLLLPSFSIPNNHRISLGIKISTESTATGLFSRDSIAKVTSSLEPLTRESSQNSDNAFECAF